MRSSSDCFAANGSQGRPARLAGRLIRVLAELELVSLDRDLPALAVAGATRTELERSQAFRVVHQATRGRTAIPQQRKSNGKQPSPTALIPAVARAGGPRQRHAAGHGRAR